MGLLNFKPDDIQGAIDGKLKPERRPGGKELQSWFVLDGARLFRITTPHKHSMSSVPPGTVNAIRRSLHLTQPEFADLVRCPLSGSDYERIIRLKVDEGHL